MSAEMLLAALFIFSMRIVDISLYTMRLMMVVRGRKRLAWIFAFFQASVYIFAIARVLTDLSNVWNLVGYAGGYATGLVVGMTIEGRLAIGHTHLQVVSPGRGEELAEELRALGYGVTEIGARGQDGAVTLLELSVLRRRADEVIRVIAGMDEEAFITAENTRPLMRGFWHV
jgi:uncharacterized protein YebE (UPF0316 family)